MRRTLKIRCDRGFAIESKAISYSVRRSHDRWRHGGRVTVCTKPIQNPDALGSCHDLDFDLDPDSSHVGSCHETELITSGTIDVTNGRRNTSK